MNKKMILWRMMKMMNLTNQKVFFRCLKDAASERQEMDKEK